jgi:hypothetical protein
VPRKSELHTDQLEDIASDLWRALCEGDGEHSEALDKAIILGHLRRVTSLHLLTAAGSSREKAEGYACNECGRDFWVQYPEEPSCCPVCGGKEFSGLVGPFALVAITAGSSAPPQEWRELVAERDAWRKAARLLHNGVVGHMNAGATRHDLIEEGAALVSELDDAEIAKLPTPPGSDRSLTPET